MTFEHGSNLHNDEPTLLDALDRGPLIREVGEAIAHCTPPQVFGVHGDWGLGKTSFLHQVQWYLTGDCPQQSESAIKEAKKSGVGIESGKHKQTIRTIWFDAWRYQHEEAPVVALLHEMRAQLSYLSRTMSKTTRVAIRGALLSIEELTKKIGIQSSTFHQASREWDVRHLATALPSNTLREHLRDAIKKLLPRRKTGSASPRLVVFIDDVDRCDSEAAYRLLEGLKIYLTLDNCVFVLAMNQRVIESAIGSRIRASSAVDGFRMMKDAIESAIRSQRQGAPIDKQRSTTPADSMIKAQASAYLEKLCQNVWRLPTVRQPDEMLRVLLEETVRDKEIRGRVWHAVRSQRCLPPNPRRIKGLANLIGRLARQYPKPKDKPSEAAAIREAEILVVVAYIYQFHPEVYVRWQADARLWNRIHDRCRGNSLDLPFLDSLVMPNVVDADEKAPVPQSSLKSAYPDPTDTNVFWIQSLVLKLDSEVDPDEFVHHLHGDST